MISRSLFAAVLLASTALAGPPLTTIQDVLYKADGTRFAGTLAITWTSFEAIDTSAIATQAINVTVTDGNLRVQLVPTTTAVPAASYTVKYNSGGRIQFSETWAVPSSVGPLRLRDVRIASTQAGAAGAADTIVATVQESDVAGLISDLGARPLKGPAYAGGRVAVVNPTGSLESVTGSPSDCVRVDGSSGPCGGAQPSFVDGDSPSGIVDGSNTTFTLSAVPNPPSSLAVYRNGVLQKLVQDYNVAGNSVQFAAGAAPQPGDALLASYRLTGTGTATGGSGGGGSGGAVSSVFGRVGLVFPAVGDYTAAQVTNAVDATASYSDPAFIAALSFAKLTGVPSFATCAGDLSGTAPGCTVGKVNGTLLSGLGTGILKNTTGTGVPSIATSGDFPTLNQSTTGTAGGLSGTALTGDVANSGNTLTIANVSSIAHGLAPIAPGDATKFLNGANPPAWTVPGGGGTGGGWIGYSGAGLTVTGTRFFPITGGGTPSSTETDVDLPAPSAATISNFYAETSVAVGAATTLTITFRKAAADTAVVCVISGGTTTKCSDTTHSFTPASNDLLSVKTVVTGTPIVGTINLMFGYAIGTSGVGVTSVFGRSPAVVAATGDYTAAQVANAVDKTAANSYTAGMTQTFQSSAANAGMSFGGVAADPTTVVEAATWYRTDLHALRQFQNGVAVTIGGGTASTSAYTTVAFSATPAFIVTANTMVQDFLLTMTANVTSSTLTATAATSGQDIALNICQDATGGWTFAPPANVTGMGTVGTVALACYRQIFRWDGTNAIAVAPMTCPVCAPGVTIPGSSSGASTVQAPATGGGTSTLPAGSGTLLYTNGSLAAATGLPLTTGVTGLLPHANMAATTVTPGPYTSANITVAADGSITAAANGSAGGVGTATTGQILANTSGAVTGLSKAGTGSLIPTTAALGVSGNGVVWTSTGLGDLGAPPGISGGAVTSIFGQTGAVGAVGDLSAAGTVNNLAIGSPKMSIANTRRTCNILIGADNGAALGTADIAPQGGQCFIPSASHIVEIAVAADGGTPSVVVAKNSAGTLTSLNASLATAAAGGLACVNVAGSGTGIDGATTCSLALLSTTLAAGDWIETRTSVSASTAKRMSIAVTYTVD